MTNVAEPPQRASNIEKALAPLTTDNHALQANVADAPLATLEPPSANDPRDIKGAMAKFWREFDSPQVPTEGRRAIREKATVLRARKGTVRPRRAKLQDQRIFEERLRTAASEYRERHYGGLSDRAVWWNKDGAEDVMAIAQEAQGSLGRINKRALSDAAGVSYATLSQWLARPAPSESPPGPLATVSKKPQPAQQVAFLIERLSPESHRLSMTTEDLKTFLQSL
jgi:hypothetical protein